MRDLIDRQAAIDALRNYLVGKNVPCDGTLTARLIENEVINKLPPAQPEPCEDAVSREAVIDLLITLTANGTNKGMICGDDAVHRVEMLPPVTPKQRTGKCMWCERLKERNLRIEYYWIDEEGCTASFSEPNIVATGIAKFCPNCGAKMTEGDAE